MLRNLLKSPIVAVFIITAILIGALSYWCQGLVWLIGGSLLLSYGLNYPVAALERRQWPHALAASAIFIIFWGLVAAGFFILTPKLTHQVSVWTHSFQHLQVEWQRMYLTHQVTITKTLSRWHPSLPKLLIKEADAITSFKLSDFSLGANGNMGSLLPLFNFVLLMGRDLILNWFYALPFSGHLVTWLQLFKHNFLGYFRGKTYECGIMVVLGWILFSVWQLPFAGILALFLGLSVFVPYLGIVLVSLPVGLMILSYWGAGSLGMLCLASYLLLSLLDAYVLAPMLLGKVLALHPLVIVLVILAASKWLGVLGAIVAIPLTAFNVAVINNLIEYSNANQS